MKYGPRFKHVMNICMQLSLLQKDSYASFVYALLVSCYYLLIGGTALRVLCTCLLDHRVLCCNYPRHLRYTKYSMFVGFIPQIAYFTDSVLTEENMCL